MKAPLLSGKLPLLHRVVTWANVMIDAVWDAMYTEALLQLVLQLVKPCGGYHANLWPAAVIVYQKMIFSCSGPLVVTLQKP